MASTAHGRWKLQTAADYGTGAQRWAGLVAAGACMLAALATPAAWANTANAAANPNAAGMALASQKNCLGCHHATQRRTGPTFKAIAERYATPAQGAQRQATLELLGRKIRQGGKGAWGVVPMPSHPQVSEAESLRLAAWILDAHR